MNNTPLFIGLTREVTFAGLPVMYLVMLITATMLGFIFTGSPTLLLGIGGVGYLTLRSLAAYDPKLIGVMVATMQQTRMHPGLFNGEGVIYRA